MTAPQAKTGVEVERLPELPDKYEAAAHMFTGALTEFRHGEKTDTAYSIPVGSPDEGTSVPLWTSDQMRAYATAALAAERAEAVRMRDENEKLRAALTEIAEREIKQRHGLTDFGESWNKGLFIGSLKEIARNALKARAALSPSQGEKS